MNYQSTRNAALTASSAEAILNGLAPDGGLYAMPALSGLDFDWQRCLTLSTQGMATEILCALLPDFTHAEMEQLVHAAYTGKFETEDLTPTVPVGEDTVLELFRGPTSAFKDVALSMLPHLMTAAKKKCGVDDEILILTATSGDTGKAAMEGFCDVAGTKIIVFYPDGGVSAVQKAQMVTQGGDNTCVAAVRGNFDDAQTAVKQVFAKVGGENLLAGKGVRLSSANSINWGRLMPQIVYYVSAYAQLVADGKLGLGDELDVCVPTGNFGNILAAYYAKRMGVPLGMLYCASNENRVLTDFINTGTYDISERPFVLTPSPSMDILVSSNLERQLFELTGRDAEAIAGWMADLREQRRFRVDEGTFARVREQFASDSIDNATCLDTIKRVFDEHDYLLDPHTAVAYRTAENLRGENPVLIASTAHWAKFGDNVYRALHGLEPGAALPADVAALSGCELNELIAQETGKHDIPRGLAELDALPIRFDEGIEGGTDSIEAAAARFLEELGAAAPGRDDRD